MNSDGTDTTDSAYMDLEIKTPGVYGGNARVVGPAARNQDNTMRNLGILVLIGGVAWFLLKK